MGAASDGGRPNDETENNKIYGLLMRVTSMGKNQTLEFDYRRSYDNAFIADETLTIER